MAAQVLKELLIIVNKKLLYLTLKTGDTWIDELSSHSTFEHWYAMPLAVRLILGDDYSFSAQA